MKKLTAAFWLLLAITAGPPPGFAWGHEGHQVIALIAEHCMTQDALAKAGNLLDGSAIDGIASWADEFRRDHPETGPWHYIDIPLADSNIDMARECPQGQCVIAQTEHSLAVLKDPDADKAAKAEALKFVVHFVGDMHQPLHDEDDGDKGGNGRHVIFDGKPDNLHWVWDTGPLEHISRNPQALASELESQITPQERRCPSSTHSSMLPLSPLGAERGLWGFGQRESRIDYASLREAGGPGDRDAVGEGRGEAGPVLFASKAKETNFHTLDVGEGLAKAG